MNVDINGGCAWLRTGTQLSGGDGHGEPSTDDSAEELSCDEQQTFDDAGTTCQQHGETDDGVEMSVTHVPHAVQHRRVRQPER